MTAKSFRQSKLVHVARDDEPGMGDLSMTHRTLRLGIVQPGTYERWEDVDMVKPGQDPLWLIEPSNSRMEVRTPDSEEEEEEDQDEVDDLPAQPRPRAHSADRTKRESLGRASFDDDPNPFVLKMKKEMDMQRQMMRIIMMAHKKAREEWANAPFKLLGQEGRGEAEVLKLLFLVVDQALEDERITTEQAEEQRMHAPYEELPTLSKCGQTFGEASAISRACATKFQLFGETVEEQLVVGATYTRLRAIQETHKRTLDWIFQGQVKDKAKIEWAQGQLLHVILPPAIKEWEAQIRSTKGPFLVESGMTLADLAIMDFLDQCSSAVMIDSLLIDHLAVSDLIEAVRSCPKLLAHLQDREED